MVYTENRDKKKSTSSSTKYSTRAAFYQNYVLPDVTNSGLRDEFFDEGSNPHCLAIIPGHASARAHSELSQSSRLQCPHRFHVQIEHLKTANQETTERDGD